MTTHNFIQTYTGIAFDLEHPAAEMIDIRDISHALSMLCRFTGHVQSFYSVAQHSCIVAHEVAAAHPALGLAALLHDAAEAYLGDWSSPLKRCFRGGQRPPATCDRLTDGVERAIEAAFSAGLTLEARAIIKAADLRALATEKRDLMSPMRDPAKASEWFASSGYAPAEPFKHTIVGLSPARAEERFMYDFTALSELERRLRER
jgi:uncharacterized protein